MKVRVPQLEKATLKLHQYFGGEKIKSPNKHWNEDPASAGILYVLIAFCNCPFSDKIDLVYLCNLSYLTM
jgi:hypothetical protein